MLHESDTGVEVLLVILVWNFDNLVNWADFPLFLKTKFLNNVPAVFSKVLFAEQFQQPTKILNSNTWCREFHAHQGILRSPQ